MRFEPAPAGADHTTTDAGRRSAKGRRRIRGNLVGVFPDPVTCTIAGARRLGRPFYCGFYFFFWGLNVL